MNKEDKDRNRKKEREGMRNKCISLATECERIWKVEGRGRARKERGERGWRGRRKGGNREEKGTHVCVCVCGGGGGGGGGVVSSPDPTLSEEKCEPRKVNQVEYLGLAGALATL